MSKTINLRKRKWVGKREVIVMVVAVIITAAGIKASDSLFNQNDKTGANLDGCPADMAFVPTAAGGICIDRFEASAGSDCPYANPSNQGESRTNLDYSNCRPVSEPARMPWSFISQDQAAVACAKAGKRLATSEEWLAAALGTPDKSGGWGESDCQVDNNWPTQPGPTGLGANCISPAGTYDMVGNVWEWVKETATDGLVSGKELPDAGYVAATDLASWPTETDQDEPNENYNEDFFWIKKSGVRGVARGGYFANGSDAGSYAAYVVTPTTFVGGGIGFRCVK